MSSLAARPRKLTDHTVSNFTFLQSTDPDLARYPTEAERYFADDPEVCLYKLRLFGEVLTHRALDHLGVRSPAPSQFERLRQLEGQYGVTDAVLTNFHALRQVGNRASHALGRVKHGDAVQQLRNARALAVWYVAEFVDPDVEVGGFVLPKSGSQAR